MGYSVTLIGVAAALVALIQALRLIFQSPSYRRRSLNLTLGVFSFFIPIVVSIMILSMTDGQINVNLLLIFSGVGSLLAIYFFTKATLNP